MLVAREVFEKRNPEKAGEYMFGLVVQPEDPNGGLERRSRSTRSAAGFAILNVTEEQAEGLDYFISHPGSDGSVFHELAVPLPPESERGLYYVRNGCRILQEYKDDEGPGIDHKNLIIPTASALLKAFKADEYEGVYPDVQFTPDESEDLRNLLRG